MEPRRPNKRIGVNDTLLYYDLQENRRRSCLCICCIICCVSIFLILLAAVLVTFVGLPMIFKNSPEFQRNLIFPTTDLLPSEPEFSNFAKYNIQGARNVYVTVDTDKNITLGVWHLLPHALVNRTIEDENFNYRESLGQAEFPVIIHFHSNGGNRIEFVNMYNVLRKYFHVIAFDYRGYADSSAIPPWEGGIVDDAVQLYNWVRYQTNADIYFWGHALGAALASHTVDKLLDYESMPMGVFLEAPFTSIRDQVQEIKLFKYLFSWLPWYESTILDPLGANGFSLNTAQHLLRVNCPVMIIHAQDDHVTPYTHSEKLVEFAHKNWNPGTQGNMTLHLLPTHLNYGHFSIHKAPELPGYIQAHINTCKAYKKIRE